MNTALRTLKTYFSPNGRIGRINYLVLTVLSSIAFILLPMLLGAWLEFALLLPYLAFVMAAGARRLHDLGKSGWWQLLNFIPILNLALAIYMVLFRGETSDNKYGPPSKA
jgi:uncharacterized membrane protein YhaH (DUF805 family)